MKKYLLITIILTFTLQVLSQEKSDSILISTNDGNIYKLDISKKEDQKIYKSLSKKSGGFKCQAKITEIGLIYIKADVMPEFPNGISSFRDFVEKSLVYPEAALKEKVEGRIYLKFIVTETGDVKYVEVLKGENEFLRNEAKRVIEASPKWKPGLVNNQPVKFEFVFPVTFTLKQSR